MSACEKGEPVSQALIQESIYKLKTFRMCGTSFCSISDKSLLFILLLIFLHSKAHVGHGSADLLKSISVINSFFTTGYFHPAAVITSNAAA